MSYPGYLKLKRFRGSLWGALVAVLLLILIIGCATRDSRLGVDRDLSPKLRWVGGDTSTLLYNARYFELLGQPAQALKQLEEAHRLYPGNVKVADALAQYYDKLGMGKQAQQIYQEALALDPDNPALLNNLGFSYYLAGKDDQAEACFRQTLARLRQNQGARNNLGLLLCRQGRREEARQLWQEAEGEVAAAQRMAQALAALGMAPDNRYAQSSRPNAGEPPARPQSPPDIASAVNPGKANSTPLPPPVSARVAPATQGAAPQTQVAAVKPMPTIPPFPKALDSTPREVPAPSPHEAAVAAATPMPHPSAAGQAPARPLPPRREMTARHPAASSPGPPTASPPRARAATPQPVAASKPEPQRAAGLTSPKQSRADRPRYLTARELVATNIAILNGSGIPYLAHDTRAELALEGFSVAAIGNYRDFGAYRTIIYYRPDSKHVATVLNNDFFPEAKVEAATNLASRIDVEVILGRDLFPQLSAQAWPLPKNKKL